MGSEALQGGGVPEGTGARTRHALALETLDERGALLPHSWVAGDDGMGRPLHFRRDLAGRHERYLLTIPSDGQGLRPGLSGQAELSKGG